VPFLVIRGILRINNHGSQKIKDPILKYNHNSQKFEKNQITSQKIVDSSPFFFHENHILRIFKKPKIGG